MNLRIALCTLALLVWCLNFDAGAQVYRCKTPGGSTEYSQVPCGKDAQLLQSQRDSIDRTNPPADPFGVKRERARLESETNYYNNKFAGDMAAKSAKPTNPVPTTRQIDRAACERADRDAKIEAGHARKDAVATKRAQQVADWDCGRDLTEDAVSPPRLSSKTQAIPSAPPNIADAMPYQPPERRSLSNCDSTGCYDNQGARYNNMGENFMGPTGMCRKTLLGWSCP